ncbi:unnamed protein product [Protopolystoma xenopodis]|uniref:Uncharacterized protein n=1 Tax=Protopolystoma xenopodis TaxID=117903 RepID=A0A448XL16_9PLAT|nr:unnamed protein product [Protopolystoma xenopodis]
MAYSVASGSRTLYFGKGVLRGNRLQMVFFSFHNECLHIHIHTHTHTNTLFSTRQPDPSEGGILTPALAKRASSIGQSIVHQSHVHRVVTKTMQFIDDLLRQIGQRCLEAVIRAVRNSLEELWRYFGLREASTILKEVPIGKVVDCGEKRKSKIEAISGLLFL